MFARRPPVCVSPNGRLQFYRYSGNPHHPPVPTRQLLREPWKTGPGRSSRRGSHRSLRRLFYFSRSRYIWVRTVLRRWDLCEGGRPILKVSGGLFQSDVCKTVLCRLPDRWIRRMVEACLRSAPAALGGSSGAGGVGDVGPLNFETAPETRLIAEVN
jgi:hypothetical protein